MVVGEGGVHHRAERDLAVGGDGAVLDGVQAEDADLRRVEDRRAHERAVDAAVRDAERPAAQVLNRQRAVVRLRGELADAALDRRERHPVRVAQHRHDQALARADGDADVVVVLQHHLVALDLGVQSRELAKRGDRRLDEERRDAEADAVARLERLFPALAERHDRRHVDLVEGREHRGRLLRLDQPPGDGRAALRHPHSLLSSGGR